MSLEAHIAVFCDFGRNEEEHTMAVASLTALLARKEASMQDMILAMGDVLTGSDDKLRARGTLLLADITRDLSVGEYHLPRCIPSDENNTRNLNYLF
jgi:hypothetical protein